MARVVFTSVFTHHDARRVSNLKAPGVAHDSGGMAYAGWLVAAASVAPFVAGAALLLRDVPRVLERAECEGEAGVARVRRTFLRHGYCVIRGFLSAPELAEARRVLEAFIADKVPSLPAEMVFYDVKGEPESLKQIQRLYEHDAYVLRVFPLCALVPRVQGSSGAVATVQFVWRGHAKTPTTRAGPWPDFALRLE